MNELKKLRPGVSVIVPVYNVSPFVRQCLNSILSSNLQELQIIVVDDHGSDNSMDIVREMANGDNRIEIIVNDRNRGLAYSRNHGLRAVKNTHVAFLDSDDWVSADFYEKLYKAALREDADIAVGNVLYTYPDTGIKREEWVSWWSFHSGNTLLTTISEKQDIIYACACWNKVYKTEFIRNNCLHFPENLFIEDVPFTFLSTTLSNRITMVKEAMHFYRQRPNSIMKDLKTSKRIFDVFKIMDICYKLLLKIPVDKREEYRKILDHFWIFNLQSWSTAVSDQDYQSFIDETKSRLRGIDITGNSYITPEHAQMYKEIVGQQECYKALLFCCIPICIVRLNSRLTK